MEVKPAEDKQEVVKEAWDEQQLVKEAWDEQVLVSEAWDEPVYDFADQCNKCDFTTFDGDAITEHCFEHQSGYHTVRVQVDTIHHDAVYETVHHDAEYKTVHHDAEYKTVHNDAVYETVHHDAVTHTETRCTTCGAKK